MSAVATGDGVADEEKGDLSKSSVFPFLWLHLHPSVPSLLPPLPSHSGVWCVFVMLGQTSEAAG